MSNESMDFPSEVSLKYASELRTISRENIAKVSSELQRYDTEATHVSMIESQSSVPVVERAAGMTFILSKPGSHISGIEGDEEDDEDESQSEDDNDESNSQDEDEKETEQSSVTESQQALTSPSFGPSAPPLTNAVDSINSMIRGEQYTGVSSRRKTVAEHLRDANGVQESLSKEESTSLESIYGTHPDMSGRELKFFLMGMRRKSEYILVQTKSNTDAMEKSLSAYQNLITQHRTMNKEYSDNMKVALAWMSGGVPPQAMVSGSGPTETAATTSGTKKTGGSQRKSKGKKAAEQVTVVPKSNAAALSKTYYAQLKSILSLVGLDTDECLSYYKMSPEQGFASIQSLFEMASTGVDLFVQLGGEEHLTQAIITLMSGYQK